jgi:hypothetical protein
MAPGGPPRRAGPRIRELGGRERRLLLACARLQLDRGGADEVGELVSQRLDWEAIVFHARLHSVAPLVHRHLAALPDPEKVPASARQRLLALRHRAGYQNRVYSGETAQLVEAFWQAGCPSIVPKGISLVELVYGDLGLRPLVDLAFIVRPSDLRSATTVLLERGYTRSPVSRVRAMWRWSCPHGWYERRATIRLSVVLQADLLSWPLPWRAMSEQVWSEARRAQFGGAAALVLSPVDQVICLCLQADCMGYFNRAALNAVDPEDLLFAGWSNNRLIRFTDIHETLRHHRDAVDWDELCARARAWGVEEAVGAILLLTESLLGRPPQGTIPGGLSPGRPPRIRRTLLRAARGRPRRPGPGKQCASPWDRLGPRRQLELFRVVGLLEAAFPGLVAVRADDRQRSTPALLWRAVHRAARILLRSGIEWLKAAEAIPLPRPAPAPTHERRR